MEELFMYFTFVYSMVNLLRLIIVITAYAAVVCKHNVRSRITLPGGVVAGLSRTKEQEVRAQYLKYLRKTGASLISN